MNTKLILSIFTLLLFVSSPMAYADVKSIWGGQEKKEVVKDKNGDKKVVKVDDKKKHAKKHVKKHHVKKHDKMVKDKKK